jgi:hypothetical protein
MIVKNQSRFSTFAALATLIASVGATTALAAPPTKSFEIGAGAVASFGQTEEVNVLIRVDYSGYTVSDRRHERLIVGRMKVHGAMGQDKGATQIRYADIELEGLRLEAGETGGLDLAAFNIGQLDITRNLAIGNSQTVTLSLIGVDLKTGGEITDGVKAYVQTTMNLILAGISTSVSGDETQGLGANLNMEVGMLFGNVFSVAIGADLTAISSPLSKDACKGVKSESDPSGKETSVCSWNNGIDGQSKRTQGSGYIKAMARLNDQLSLFGEVHDSVYKITSRSHPEQDNKVDATQFFFGVSGSF